MAKLIVSGFGVAIAIGLVIVVLLALGTEVVRGLPVRLALIASGAYAILLFALMCFNARIHQMLIRAATSPEGPKRLEESTTLMLLRVIALVELVFSFFLLGLTSETTIAAAVCFSIVSMLTVYEQPWEASEDMRE